MNELERRLADTSASDPALHRLRDTLARRAQEGGLLDVAYRTVDTPAGELLLAGTPVGLVRIAYPRQDHDTVLADLAGRISPRILHAPGRLDAAARQLEEYFTTGRHSFDLPLDLQLARGFRRTVLEHLRAVATATRSAMRGWPPTSAAPALCAPSAPPVRRTRCRWSSPATASSAATAGSASTSVGPTSRSSSCSWSGPPERPGPGDRGACCPPSAGGF
jgi:hypothetical protein